MSKEAAAAILVQTLFTADKSLQNLVMSHAKIGDAKPKDVVAIYCAVLSGNAESDGQQRKAKRKTRKVAMAPKIGAIRVIRRKRIQKNKGERGSVKKAGV